MTNTQTAVQEHGYAFHQLGARQLPDNWAEQVMTAVRTRGTHVVKQGKGPGSLEDDATAGLDYYVLTGDKIEQHLPWMFDWYKDPATAEEIGAIVGEHVRASPYTNSAINVNLVMGEGGRYELHVDAHAYTTMLYVNTLHEDDGGELFMLMDNREEVLVRPVKGYMLTFDGSAIPHAVRPLKRMTSRVSIPMHFFPDRVTDEDARPEGLDSYLFEAEDAA